MIKERAARVNLELGLLDRDAALAIMEAAEEVIEGASTSIPLDIFQTGSGTSTNMNANEVIANRAGQLGGAPAASGSIPTTTSTSASRATTSSPPPCTWPPRWRSATRLMPALQRCRRRSAGKRRSSTTSSPSAAPTCRMPCRCASARCFPATPARSPSACGAWRPPRRGCWSCPWAAPPSAPASTPTPSLPAGSSPAWPRSPACPCARRPTTSRRRRPRTPWWRPAARCAAWPCALFKIANDIRFLASGPRCGLGELVLPAVQPGSSIMPGKVNPVMAESLMQVCAQVIGNDAAIALGGLSGNFELNVMMPVMAHNLLQSIELLARAVSLFAERCFGACRPTAGAARRWWSRVWRWSPPWPRPSATTGRRRLPRQARDRARPCARWRWEEEICDEDELARLLDPRPMTEPGMPGKTR